MKKCIVILLLCFVTNLFAQKQTLTKLALMQGIWDYTMSTEISKSFKVVKGKTCLEFSFTTDSNDLEFTLLEMFIGFQSSITKYDETKFIQIDSLKENGLYYTEVVNKKYIEQDGLVDKAFCMIPSYYQCDGEMLSINGGKLFEYERVPKLPINALEKLHYRGKRDKRNYIGDYLNIKVIEIIKDEVKVYSKPDNSTIAQLSKGDIATVLEEDGTWLKVDYGAENPGWVKRSDTQ